jgi:hypothetical protein
MARPRTLSIQRGLELCAEYSSGSTLSEVAKAAGKSPAWMVATLRKHGVPARRSALYRTQGAILARLNEAQKAEALAMRRQPRRKRPSWTDIRKHFEANGVDFSGIGPIQSRAMSLDTEVIEKAAMLYRDERQSLARVAKAIGIYTKTLQAALLRHGVKMRGRREATASLNEDLVWKLRVLRLRGYTYFQLARVAKQPRNTVTYAVRGLTWKHVPFPTFADAANNNAAKLGLSHPHLRGRSRCGDISAEADASDITQQSA